MRILQGGVTPKHLMLWIKNYNDKIYKNPLLESAEKWAILKKIVDKEVQLIARKVEGSFELYAEPKYIVTISDHVVQIKILLL